MKKHSQLLLITYEYFEQDFHAMRDHPMHDTSILGGLWGVKFQRQVIREKFADSFNQLLLDPLANATRNTHGPDQTALTKYFWYEVKMPLIKTT